MWLTNAVFARMVVDVRSMIESMSREHKSWGDGDYRQEITEQPNEILKCAMYMFLGDLDGATQYVSFASRNLANVGRRSVRGRRSRKSPTAIRPVMWRRWRRHIAPWGRNPDEDDRRFAYRCMMQAHKMLKPTQAKRSVGESR